MKKSLLVLSVLLLFGACSTAVDLPNGVKGTGDAVLDAGLKDALAQIGSTRGLTQWIHEGSDAGSTEVPLKTKWATSLFLGKDNYKDISATLSDGKIENVVFNNEIISLEAREGTLSTTGDFKVFQIDSSITNDVTKEFSDKGYTRIYTMTPKRQRQWLSKKSGGA
ncbi:MAG: hypothetical protein ACRCWI_01640, partial [Brevinema sp.]